MRGAAALAGGDSGAAIVPGASAESLLFQRIASADEAERMPPVDSGVKPLTSDEIELVRTWIDAKVAVARDGRDRQRSRFRPLGVSARPPPGTAGGQERGLGPQPDRSFRAGAARGRGYRARRPQPTDRRSSSGSTTICSDCRPAPKWSTPFWPTPRRTLTSSSSIAC